ncbi:MAG: LPXTG cell wall anchor domain-containing protein, partial [Mogibacterium sp.]|nr:LPXTG cell wall anchor domain-containing protein [Mogibacterium sp.]
QIEISKDDYEKFTSGKLENRRKPIELTKVNENGEAITASDATFVLTKAIQDSGSNNWYVFEGKAHQDRTILDASRIGFGASAAKTYTTQNGKLTIDNLDAGNYLLFETNAPTGFARTRTPWLIKVTKNDSTGCEWQIWRIKDEYTNMYKDSSGNNQAIPDTSGNEQKAYGMFWPAGDTGWFEAVNANENGSYNIKNEPRYLTKVDESTISSSDEADLIKLKGAKFHLYGTHTNTFSGYNYIRQDASKLDIQLEETGSDGKIKLPSSVTSTNGTYFLVEEQNGAPGGYYPEEYPWLLIVNNGSIRILKTSTAHSYTNNYGKWWKYGNSANVDQFKTVSYTDSYRIPNRRMPVSLTKVDGYTGEKLGGAEFRVYKTTEYYYSSNVHYQTILWNQYRDASSLPETGKISFSYTDNGYYLVEEVTPPDGYTITNKYWMVWIDTTYGYSNATVYVFKAEKYSNNVYMFKDGMYLTECARDEIPNYPSVNLTKVDLKTVDIDVANDGSGKTTYGINQDTIKLNGVGFQLFNASVSGNNWTQGTRVSIDGEDENGISWTKKVGDNDGVLELGSLGKDKKYLLVETDAKDGYIKPDYAWRLHIDVNGNLSKVEAVTGSNGKYVETNHILTNRPHYDLPKTGGMGTYWFMIIGAMMMTFAVTTLIIRKKGTEKL